MEDSYQELCVTSSLANLAEIAAFVAERAMRAGLRDDDVFAVQMAVDEACTNAMEHGYGGRQDGRVHVCCYLDGHDFVVRITDDGRPFDPSSVRAPDLSGPLEEREIGGLGLFFMRAMMDGIVFRRNGENQNELVMRKHRRGNAHRTET